jgi:hypothetical protein
LDWLWAAIEKLNVLRNKLAHHLNPKGFDRYLDEFLDFVEKGPIGKWDQELIDEFGRLPWALASIHTALSAHLRIKPKTILGGGL